MRSGYETNYTFAVPSRRAPRYVIAAILNDVTTLPGSWREDRLTSPSHFAIRIALTG
jgi:hypothetical protein